MASSYNIADGDGELLISSSNETSISVQLVGDTTNANVVVKLKQTEDGANFIDLADTSTTLTAGSNTIVLDSTDFTLAECYLDVVVGSATTGTINIFVSSKKKDNEISATIGGVIDTNVTNSELDVAIDSNSEVINLLRNILKEQKYTNKLLNKILN